MSSSPHSKLSYQTFSENSKTMPEKKGDKRVYAKRVVKRLKDPVFTIDILKIMWL